MRKITLMIALFVAMATVFTSCSKDEEKVPEDSIFQSELLINTWNYQSLSITGEPSFTREPLSNEELLAMANETYSGFEITFRENGTGSIFQQGIGREEFTYEFIFGEATINIEGYQTITLEDINIENGVMEFNWYGYVENAGGDGAEFSARYTMK